MGDSTSVISRFESKYVISESEAQAIAQYVRGVCSPDRHAQADGRYTVNNLYFDTQDLRFYHDTRCKRFTRFKPRVRYYGTECDGTLWLELKHKFKNVTWKVRRPVPLTDWARLLLDFRADGGRETMRRELVSSFEDALLVFGAEPVLFVRYVREPYVSDIDAYARITFDRRLSYRLAEGSADLFTNAPYSYYDDAVSMLHSDDESPVLLEIKTETRVPNWVVALIRRFNLTQRGFSKYCNAMEHSMTFGAPAYRLATPFVERSL